MGTNVRITANFNPLNVNGTIHPIPDISTAACGASLLLAQIYLEALQEDIELTLLLSLATTWYLHHTLPVECTAAITDSLYLNAEGNTDAVFVIKVNGALTTSTLSKVILINGAQAKNVYWHVNGAVTISDYSIFNGTIVSDNGAITLLTGVTLNGRALTTDGLFNVSAVIVNGPLSDCVTIPLKWLTFTAEKTNKNDVLLKWSTANEINNHHFEIQRSNNGIDFLTIGTVATGIGAAENHYTFTDNKTINGNSFYRIKQVDRDANFKYSVTQPIKISGGQWSLFPNPAPNYTNILFRQQLGIVAVSLIDVNGKSIYKRSLTSVKAGEVLYVPLMKIEKGIYIMKMESAGVSTSEKIIVQ